MARQGVIVVNPAIVSAELRARVPVNVGQVLRNAAVFNFARRWDRKAFMDSDNLPAEVEAFFQPIEERAVPYLLVGGVALLAHVRGRNTEDLDLVLSMPDQRRLPPEVTIVDRAGFFATGRFRQNLRIDFLATEDPLFASVTRDDAEERTLEFLEGGRRVPCATPEGLVLFKLYALPLLYRQCRFERTTTYESDLAKLLAAFPQMNTDGLLAVLARHGVSASDGDALRKLLMDVRPGPPQCRWRDSNPHGALAPTDFKSVNRLCKYLIIRHRP